MSEGLEAKVAASDPDRHAASLAAPPQARAKLWVLYAFNLEIARAPYLTHEPLIAQMRLQFWADVLDDIAAGKPPRAHEVAEPLARIWVEHALPLELGQQMIAARHWHIERAAFADISAWLDHIDQSAGNLMWLAARLLGAPDRAEAAVRAMGRASGAAQWLQAVPALQAAGRVPVPRGGDGAEMAQAGLAALAQARRARATVPKAALPALLAAFQAGPVLKQAAREPARIEQGALGTSEFRRRGTLLLRGVSQRW
ncbi:MAG: phytoene synthase-like protein [Roseibaca calidilacus]|uniref:Phytoene synthase-like protein n=1 Tax=Roseibaca calidilacus TaxID=1666912 RepID=A0A0P7W7M0_9RHOB|nr:squalene/phytoene synthase family protein [Roseibaca calidilacus]KPP95924.1 MAG: phytoene synthase-like protein [Roseibaca calidilacus]CUX81484.1 Squalene/phytoene synthase [Roseibaca calidilacus]